MLDREGFRPNVGIILLNQRNQVFWGKRIRSHSWQFPQGGIDRGETPEQAMYRELHEEVGLMPEHVNIVARTRDWLRYEVPDRFIRRDARGHYKGQKQIWYLLRLVAQGLEPEPARYQPSRVRRLALARLLGASGAWWWSSSAASTKWRSPNWRATCPETTTGTAFLRSGMRPPRCRRDGPACTGSQLFAHGHGVAARSEF